MEMNQTILDELWEVLNLFDDYCSSGFKQEHPPAPRLPEPGAAPPALSSPEEQLSHLNAQIADCTRCSLSETRKQVVCGTGGMNCSLFIIGDAPDGADESAGAPFAGEYGEYLDKWLQAIQLNRKMGIFLTNLIKCRPEGDRPPDSPEIAACFPYLEAQLKLVQPKVLLCTGLYTARTLTGDVSAGLESLRGKVYHYCKVPFVVTYHPRAVLADPSLRALVWADLKLLRTLIE